MKQFNGYDQAKEAANYTGAEKIPVGAYVCEIKSVKYESLNWGDVIALAFDVAEGEQKDFFKKQYEANNSEDKKWKGSVRINVPKDDGTEQDGWTKNAFARYTDSFEKSNKGYSWDWDENKWKGLKIGLVFGPTGTVIDGKEVLYHEVHGCCSVDAVKDGSFYQKYLELKQKNGYIGNRATTAATSNTDFMAIAEGAGEEIPF